MAKKNDTIDFLNSELKRKANLLGHTPHEKQATFKQAAVNRVKTKATEKIKEKPIKEPKP